MLRRFEQVNQLDNVLVLAHLQHFDFSALLENLDRLHIGFGDGLDSDLPAITFMLGKLNHTKLTFTKVRGEIVVLIDVELANDLANGLDPLLLVLSRLEVQDSRFVGWQDYLHRVEVVPGVRVHLWLALLDESTRETMHHSLICVTLLTVA